MPLIGCRRKFVHDNFDKTQDIRTLQKVKISIQQAHSAQPIKQQDIKRQQEQAFQTYPRSERQVAESVNWSGQDEVFYKSYSTKAELIYYPCEMIQEEVYYQWSSFKIIQDQLSKDSEITDESSDH